jgi:hypothetical protein
MEVRTQGTSEIQFDTKMRGRGARIVLSCSYQRSCGDKAAGVEVGELASTIQSHQVELTLTGGTRVTGDVAAIRDDAMVLDVKKSSDAKAYPKGNASIPRGSIQLVKLKRSGAWGKTLGTTLGVLSGIVVGGYVARTRFVRRCELLALDYRFRSVSTGLR